MYRIVTKEALKPTVILYEIEAPMVAKKAQPGQFIILRANPSFTPLQHAHGPAKDKYADVMNIRLSKGRRNEIKAFCTNCGVTVTQYIESSFEFFAREVAAGNIVISKGGITKVTQ